MKRSNNSFLPRLIAGMLLFCAATACDEIPTTRVLAQVMETKGDVFVLEGSSRSGLTMKTTLGAGQDVETDKNATAMIALLPGMVVQMNGDTLIKIDKLRLVKSGNDTAFAMRLRQARIELVRGSVQVAMPVTPALGELEVATPAGAVIAPETNIFYIGCTGDTVRAVAARGGLNFRNNTGGHAKLLSPGYYIEWQTGRGLPASEAQRLETDGEASAQAKRAFEVERRATELRPEMRNTRPPGFATVKER